MILAFVVSLLAGLATAIGGLLAVFTAVQRRSTLAFALAFAAGAMLMISALEIVPRGYRELSASFGAPVGLFATAGAFVLGGLIVLGIDRALPRSLNPADIAGSEQSLSSADRDHNVRLMRSGVLVAGIVALHNVPEGLSTFLSTLEDPALGVSLAIAVAIHNVPEGIAVAVPILAATSSRSRAFWWATFSGLAEPLGALLGFLVISLVIPDELFTLTFGLIAGMMVLISLRELLPAARRYQTRPMQTVAGLAAGGGVMLLSLYLLS